MSLIYKPNQGYWVRTMTAVFVGVLVLAGAGWTWQQLELVRLPTPTWQVDVVGLEGEAPAPGQPVQFVDAGGVEQIDVATATVDAWNPTTRGAGTLIVRGVALAERDFELVSADTFRIAGPAATGPATQGVVRTARGIPVFEPTYLQAAGAGVVLLAGAALIYWLVGVKRKTVEFLIATDGEMKKVNWSTRKEVTGSTIVVVVATFLIAAVLFVIDFAFSSFFAGVGVLER